MRASLPLVLALSLALGAGSARAAGEERPDRRELPYVVESYYKARWGHAQEFIDLFRKNHYPLLARQIEKGLVLRVDVVGRAPRCTAPRTGAGTTASRSCSATSPPRSRPS